MYVTCITHILNDLVAERLEGLFDVDVGPGTGLKEWNIVLICQLWKWEGVYMYVHVHGACVFVYMYMYVFFLSSNSVHCGALYK